MPDFATLSVFLTAAFLLIITPGPDLLYTLARMLHGGKAAGMAFAGPIGQRLPTSYRLRRGPRAPCLRLHVDWFRRLRCGIGAELAANRR